MNQNEDGGHYRPRNLFPHFHHMLCETLQKQACSIREDAHKHRRNGAAAQLLPCEYHPSPTRAALHIFRKGSAVPPCRPGSAGSLASRSAPPYLTQEAYQWSLRSSDEIPKLSGPTRLRTSSLSALHPPSFRVAADTYCKHYLQFTTLRQGAFLHYIPFSKTKRCFQSNF